jgi:DNA-binding beta-propeller fold protein YncE
MEHLLSNKKLTLPGKTRMEFLLFFLFVLLLFILSGCVSPESENAPLEKKAGPNRGEIDNLPRTPKAAGGWEIETLVAPPPIISAPFGIGVYPDGRILIDGPRGNLVAVGEEGMIIETNLPSGGPYFSITDNGNIWYYHMFQGQLMLYDAKKSELRVVAEMDQAFSTGSISAKPDGSVVYITIGVTAGNEKSQVYRYTREKELELILEGGREEYMTVEVSAKGEVFLGGGGRVMVYRDGEVFPRAGRPDTSPLAMTSSPDGTLYYSAHGPEKLRGIYRLKPEEKKGERILSLPEEQSIPLGLAWDPLKKRLLALQKVEHQVSVVESGGLRGLVRAEMISTPIAVAVSPDEGIYVNGDEVGVQRIDRKTGDVSLFCGGLVSFQPPPSGMAFSREGELYYAGSAPGMPSIIYRIDRQGEAALLWEGGGRPAGIALSPGGEIFITDYERNGIYQLKGDELSLVRGNLPHPVGLVLGADGYFYAALAERITPFNRDSLQKIPRTRIVKCSAEGNVETLASFPDKDISFFDMDDNGNIYLPLGTELLRITPEGEQEILASGFGYIRDAALMGDGSVVITDYLHSAVYLLNKKEDS